MIGIPCSQCVDLWLCGFAIPNRYEQSSWEPGQAAYLLPCLILLSNASGKKGLLLTLRLT